MLVWLKEQRFKEQWLPLLAIGEQFDNRQGNAELKDDQ